MNLASEAGAIIDARQAEYGDRVASWEVIGRLAEELQAPGDGPRERAICTLIAMKLVRASHSPQNPDHYRDACGYLAMLGEARGAAAKQPSSVITDQLRAAIGGG